MVVLLKNIKGLVHSAISLHHSQLRCKPHFSIANLSDQYSTFLTDIMHATTLFFSLLAAAASVVALPTLAERQISGSISVNFYPTSDPGCNKNDALIEDFTLFTPSSCTLIDIEGQAIGGTLLNENDLNSGCSRTFLCSPLLCRSTEHMSKI